MFLVNLEVLPPFQFTRLFGFPTYIVFVMYLNIHKLEMQMSYNLEYREYKIEIKKKQVECIATALTLPSSLLNIV